MALNNCFNSPTCTSMTEHLGSRPTGLLLDMAGDRRLNRTGEDARASIGVVGTQRILPRVFSPALL